MGDLGEYPLPAPRLGVPSGSSEGGISGRHKVQALIIREP
jgi:hypothetical protein